MQAPQRRDTDDESESDARRSFAGGELTAAETGPSLRERLLEFAERGQAPAEEGVLGLVLARSSMRMYMRA